VTDVFSLLMKVHFHSDNFVASNCIMSGLYLHMFYIEKLEANKKNCACYNFLIVHLWPAYPIE
jgi:hypothetical protein